MEMSAQTIVATLSSLLGSWLLLDLLTAGTRLGRSLLLLAVGVLVGLVAVGLKILGSSIRLGLRRCLA
jgi:hypothetical protein